MLKNIFQLDMFSNLGMGYSQILNIIYLFLNLVIIELKRSSIF